MIERIRPAYSDAELKRIYSEPHQTGEWFDHEYRKEVTVAMARANLPKPESITDLSCGDAWIPMTLALGWKCPVWLGDFAAGYSFAGPIEKTINEVPDGDLFVLSETLEHLDDPIGVLLSIREKFKSLLLSTPVNDMPNEQHYWKWDTVGIKNLLEETGWKPEAVTVLQFPSLNDYGFQIWVAR